MHIVAVAMIQFSGLSRLPSVRCLSVRMAVQSTAFPAVDARTCRTATCKPTSSTGTCAVMKLALPVPEGSVHLHKHLLVQLRRLAT